MERQIPKAGEFYRHCKDKMYQIIAVATHTETKEKMVVYQALYGTFSIYVRPLDMFLSEVEKVEQKVEEPEPKIVEQEPKIIEQKVVSKKEIKKEVKKEVKKEIEDTFVARNKAEAYMVEFLDATTYKERIEILDKMKSCCTENVLQNLALSLDIQITEKDLELQFMEFRKALIVCMKYEGGRLRE